MQKKNSNPDNEIVNISMRMIKIPKTKNTGTVIPLLILFLNSDNLRVFVLMNKQPTIKGMRSRGRNI